MYNFFFVFDWYVEDDGIYQRKFQGEIMMSESMTIFLKAQIARSYMTKTTVVPK
jgi:hypothetical protein